jgi:LuxR family transcriptional regulator, maltose regulon positive regulatory protein
MGSAVGADAVADGAAGPGAGGVVARPRLFGRLGAARVAVVSGPAGSGKTVLLRSWIGQAGAAGSVAWVPVGRGQRDPERFWLSVLGALRQTAAGSALVQPLTAAPDLGGWTITERLLADLAPLQDRVWLVVDDVHELSSDALRQLELVIIRAPQGLRFVLATRRDVRLGLHRLRLEGELAEIREPDLRFTVAEAEELFGAAGVQLPDPRPLVERTEGWAAGLRLAALAVAAHPDQVQFAAEFTGSERTVAEYLLAEVLDRQSEPVRRLLLRTSVLDRVSGELADALTGGSGGERILQDLENANAFVVALDPARSWFRYHRLFSDLLQLELRRTAPDEVIGLHRAASQWLAEHGHPVEAIRHAQGARDWGLATRLLADHSTGLTLDGHGRSVHELLTAFPAGAADADAELSAQLAADEVLRGSLEAAQRYLAGAIRGSASVPAERRERFQLQLALLRMAVAEERGDLRAAVNEARPLLAAEAVGDDLRVMALTRLGVAELWALRADDAGRHLEQAATLARRIGRPWLEARATSHWAWAAGYRSLALATERSAQAIELAAVNGWADEPVVAVAYLTLCVMRTWQGRLEEAETLLGHAGRASLVETEPAAAMLAWGARGFLENARGRYAEALAAYQAIERPARLVVAAFPRTLITRAHMVQTLVRLDQAERAERFLAGLDERQRDFSAIRVAEATLRLAGNDPHAAASVLAPVLDGSAPVTIIGWLPEAFLLEAIARDALGDLRAADAALEHALDLAEPDGVLLPFLMFPAPGLLERHARQRTAHAALLAEIRDLLAGKAAAPSGGPRPPLERLSESEIRVLRYLPTHMSMRQIADELYVSHNTVRTHVRHLYAKLGTHTRADTVAQARALGLLAPGPLRGKVTLPG